MPKSSTSEKLESLKSAICGKPIADIWASEPKYVMGLGLVPDCPSTFGSRNAALSNSTRFQDESSLDVRFEFLIQCQADHALSDFGDCVEVLLYVRDTACEDLACGNDEQTAV